MSECLFCKIASGSIPVLTIYQDDQCFVFPDINPQAPSHLLVIPKEHFEDVTEVPASLLGHLLQTAASLAKEKLPEGHRIVTNTGTDGGQTVQHLHLHVLGGRPMRWPPG